MNEKYRRSPQVLQQFLETSRQYLTAPTIEQAQPQKPASALKRSAPSQTVNYRRTLPGTAPTFALR